MFIKNVTENFTRERTFLCGNGIEGRSREKSLNLLVFFNYIASR